MPAFLVSTLVGFPKPMLFCEEIKELGLILSINNICVHICYVLIIRYLNLRVRCSQQ